MRKSRILMAGMLLVAMASTSAAAPASTARPVGKAPAQPYKLDCSISPDLCMTEPIARGCGEGRHWSSAGSGLAHCVDDDRDCADGKAGKRDEYDNLVCADEKEVADEEARKGTVESTARVVSQQEEGRMK